MRLVLRLSELTVHDEPRGKAGLAEVAEGGALVQPRELRGWVPQPQGTVTMKWFIGYHVLHVNHVVHVRQLQNDHISELIITTMRLKI